MKHCRKCGSPVLSISGCECDEDRASDALARGSSEPVFMRQAEVLVLLGISEETLRAMRACDPELAVDLTGRGRLWYRRERVLAKLGNAKFKSAELKRAETGAGPPNPGGKAQ